MYTFTAFRMSDGDHEPLIYINIFFGAISETKAIYNLAVYTKLPVMDVLLYLYLHIIMLMIYNKLV